MSTEPKKYRELNDSIGQLIKKIRKNKGLSQMKLASMLGISYQQLQKYEYGRSQISIGRLKQIADVLDISINTFIQEPSRVPEIDEHVWLSHNEVRLLKLFRRLRDEKEQESIMGMFSELLTLMNRSDTHNSEKMKLGRFATS
jgi:transcriptional regulator with XRE-family HTH domain